MKKIVFFILLILTVKPFFAQEFGNINYDGPVWIPDNNINVEAPVNSDISISVKGLANIKADSYVAIFNVTQTGETAEEVTRLINERINNALDFLKTKEEVEVYVDMLSFVPVYEYENDKKIFSKKTYNEIPAGFELSKNIHVKYSNPVLLTEIMSMLAKEEIYDLVKVDYFSKDMERIKKQLREQAKAELKEKLKDYNELLSINIDTIEKNIREEYSVKMPVEMYKSYKAYRNSSLSLHKKANLQQADKTVTHYYQPVYQKEFDFVLNPVILEPVIQVMYELKLNVNREQYKEQKNSREYILVTPNGELKKLEF